MGRPSAFSLPEILGVLAVCAVLVLGSWGLVTFLGGKPNPASPEKSSPGDFSVGLEKSLGGLVRDNLEQAFDAKILHNERTDQALAVIKKRLVEAVPEPLAFDPEIVVLDKGDMNAMTLPGGTIVVFRGLLDRADSAEEVAAVLAHEFGHVAHRDISHAVVRNAALGAVLASTGDLDPSVVISLIRTLTQKSLDRTMEASADQYGRELLVRANLSPAHFADFLAKIDRGPKGRVLEGELSYWNDHPATEQRLKLAKEAAKAFLGPEKPLGISWSTGKDSLDGKP